jgi:hypothetical protein
VEILGLRDVTIVLHRDPAGQVLYRSDPTSGVSVVSKSVVSPDSPSGRPIKLRPATTVRQPGALPEGCDPAVSSLEADPTSDFGMRCLTSREENVNFAQLFD